MKLYSIMAVLASLPFGAMAQEVVPIAALDFPSQMTTDQFIFFPAKQDFKNKAKVGVVWFNKFYNTVDEVGNSEHHKQWRTIEISVKTLALDEQEGKYTEFFANSEVYDEGDGRFWSPRPNTSICSATAELKGLLINEHSSVFNGGSITSPCFGVLTVHKDKVKDVERMLKANKGINVDTQFKGCSKKSPIVRFSGIAKELLSQGTIGKTWGKGNFFEIMWATYKMAKSKPDIFGKFAKEASTDFLSKLYERSKDDMPIVRVDATIHNEFYLDCKPKDYTFSYGD